MKVLTSNILLFCYCITTNATEWPKKLWKRQIKGASSLSCLAIGSDGESMLAIARINGQNKSMWINAKGEIYESSESIRTEAIIHINSNIFIYRDASLRAKKVTMIKRSNDQYESKSIQINANFAQSSGKGIPQRSHLGITSEIGLDFEEGIYTCWDFRPPLNFDEDQVGNNGDGEMSRLSIGTSGPDISIAADGKLGGPAELQKSNDLKNWRKLGDVPANGGELLITPRDNGNEFFRLRKKE